MTPAAATLGLALCCLAPVGHVWWIGVSVGAGRVTDISQFVNVESFVVCLGQ